MARIRSRDTGPELRLRSVLHRLGLRFRVCARELPGKPDIIFSRKKIAVQVRGCFWHQHLDCKGGRIPRSNLEYWRPKLDRNVQRDAQNDNRLRCLGWLVIVIWECELKDESGLAKAADMIEREIKLRARFEG